jgi:predicted anti-sigma-YlaC factor YlaD
MSHQPFETWILDDEPLTQQSRRELQDHLEGCAQCRRLQGRWQAAQMELRARRMAPPMPGFTQRWQAGLAERRAREQRRQAWKIFGIMLACAMGVSLLMGIYTLTFSSPTDWLVTIIRTFASARDIIGWIVSAALGWLHHTPLALNVALWIYLSVAMCMLALALGIILWRANKVEVGVHNQ